MGPLSNGQSWFLNGGDPETNWDDPPSIRGLFLVFL